MRFKRWPRYGWSDTPRKRAALRRKQRLEREALPLLADIVAEQQPDEDAVMAERAAKWLQWEADDRRQRAARWRQARARLNTYGNNVRRSLIAAWNDAPYPADPGYLLDMCHRYDTGRFSLDAWPWTPEGWQRLPSGARVDVSL